MAKKTSDLETMTADAIWDLWSAASPACSGDFEGGRFRRAWHRARHRECDAEVLALPESAQVKLTVAAYFLETTSTAMLSWIYKGRLTGTKKPRGPRSFHWTVPVGEIRRLRVEQDARITRERAWMQEPAGDVFEPTPRVATTETISASEFVRMFGSDPEEDARKAEAQRKRWRRRLEIWPNDDEADDAAGA